MGALWALAATSIMGIILISLFSFIVLSNPDPTSLIPFFSLGTLMPCMFAGGFICAKKVKGSPLLCGVLSGGLTVTVYLLISLILREIESSGNSALVSIIIHVCAVLFSVLGAYAGNIRKPGKKRRFG
jgi:putative membrane protein (TIGR04086 family)